MSEHELQAARTLRCSQCGMESTDGFGWRAYLTVGPEDDEEIEEVAVFCPACAALEFDGD